MMTKNDSVAGATSSDNGSWSESSLDGIKIRLNQKLVELEQRTEAAARHLRTLHSSDSAEQAQERENDDVLAAIKQESTLELGEVKKALQRIEDHEYGVCRQCFSDISPQRLAALPYATLCIHCAEKDEC